MACSKLRCPLGPPDCGLFLNRDAVLNHAARVHKIPISRCDECEILVDNLMLHQKQVHESKPFKCTICINYFSSKNNRRVHYETQHAARVGLHCAQDGLQMDRNKLPPNGADLTQLMDSLGYPSGYTLDQSNDHFIIGLDPQGRTAFTFHVITPAVVASKLCTVFTSPLWWKKIVVPAGLHKGHLVTGPDIAHLPNPYETATVMKNWILMDEKLNQSLWNSIEQHSRKLASVWNEILVFNAVQYADNSGPDEKKPLKVGKAWLMRRFGEEKLMCFVAPNSANTGFLLSAATSLEKFGEEMGMEFFKKVAKAPNINDVREEDIFRCNLKSCGNQYLDPAVAKVHSDAHVKQKPNERARPKRRKHNYFACLRCTYEAPSKIVYQIHMDTKHSPKPETSTDRSEKRLASSGVDENSPRKKFKSF